jgi:hypothetical protein
MKPVPNLTNLAEKDAKVKQEKKPFFSVKKIGNTGK